MPYIGSAVKSINTRSAIDHQQFLGSTADTITNPGFYTFYVNYSPGNISVFVAGNNISHTDYTANNGTDVRISTGTLTINPTDNVEIIGYNVPTSQVLERAEVNITGGTISNTTISNSNFIGVNNAQLSVGLPIVDSSGNTVISESGGTVTIANSVQLSADSVVSSSSHTFRNKIINGNFDIWQRGPSLSIQGFCADRWFVVPFNSTQATSQQLFTNGQTEVPGNPKFYHRMVVTSVAGSGNYVVVQQRIEGVETLAGKTATLSFWAKADANKNIATEFFQYFGTGGSPSSNINTIGVTTHNLTTSWQKFTTTISIPSISGKTIGTDGNDFVSIIFWLEAGSDLNSSTNSLGNQSGTFDIAQVQLEEGAVATPFEHRPIGVELGLCQRYYATSIPKGYTITNFPTGADGAHMIASGSNDLFGYVPFPLEMRAAPTTYIYSSTNRASGKVRNGATGTDHTISSYQPQSNNNKNLVYFSGVTSATSAGQHFTFHYVASAEL